MLPKSDQNQAYIWVDTPKNYSIKKTEEVAKYLNIILNKYISNSENKEIDDKYKIINNISYWVWLAPNPDFSNLFRWSNARNWEENISIRINFNDKNNRKITSEEFIIKTRPTIQNEILSKYPNIKLRFLEDPPWPPIQSTFMLKVSWYSNTNYEKIENLSIWLNKKIKNLLITNNVKDIYTTKKTYKTNYKIELNYELISRLWLNWTQIAQTINNIFAWSYISTYHDEKSKENINIYLTLLNEQKENINIFEKISFTNKNWIKIPLKEIAKIIPTEEDKWIYSYDKYSTVYIYWEMWNNSVIYPMIKLINLFLKEEFWEWKFKVLSWNPYSIEIEELASWEQFIINLMVRLTILMWIMNCYVRWDYCYIFINGSTI